MDQLSKLIKNISIYTIGNLINKSIGFILIPIYSIYLSTEDYGIISSMALLMSFTAIIISLSLERSLNRCYFDYDNDNEKKVFIGTIVISSLTFSSIFLFLLFIFSDFIGLIFKSIPFYPYYFFCLTTLYLSTLYNITIIYFRITEQSKKFVIMSMFYLLLNSTLVIYFVVILKNGAEGKLTGNLLANMVFIPISFIILRGNVIYKFNKKMFQNAIFYSLPIIPSLLAAFITNISDRVFVEKILDLSALGIYSMGYQIAGVIPILGAAFYGAYNPMFFRIMNQDTKDKNYLKIIQDNYHIIMLTLYFTAFLFAKQIFSLLLDPKFYESYIVFQIIIIANMINSTFDILGLSYSQEKRMVRLMYITISGGVLNLLLNFYFIPRFGIYGACYTTLISFIFVGLVKYVYAPKNAFILFNWNNIFIISLFMISITTIDFFLNFDSLIQVILSKIALVIPLYILSVVKIRNQLKTLTFK